MIVRPEDIEAYAAGELSDDEAQRVLAAILEDPDAAAELDHCLQLRAAGPDLVRSAPARPKWRRAWAIAAVTSALAAAGLALVCTRTRETTAPPPALALASHRTLTARLSWTGADGYRPYETARGSAAGVEPLSFEQLATLEATKDPDAIVAGHVLVGNLERARQLVAAPTTANAWSDRAAIALVAGDADGALVAAAQALALAPDHAPAHWNHALAAQALHLDRVAATELEQLATRGEPGWSSEARARAAALRAQQTARTTAYDAVRAAGEAMLAGGPVEPMLAYVPQFTGLARLYFYDAMRLATDATRVRALAPLARALDAAAGGEVLQRHVERAARAIGPARASLAARYGALRGDTLPLDQVPVLLRDAASDPDIALGVMLIGGAVVNEVDAKNLDAYVALATATADPWFSALALEQRARRAISAGDIDRAEVILRDAPCDARAVGYRCQRLAYLRTHVYFTLARTAATERAWKVAHALAIAEGVPSIEQEVLALGARLAALRDGVSGSQHPLAVAYLHELELASAYCPYIHDARDFVGQSLVNRGELAEARALFAAEPACDAPFTVSRAFVLAQIAESRAATEALLGEVAKLRAVPTTSPGDRALLDHVEGRVLLGRGDPRGRTLLEEAAARPAPDVFARRVRSYDIAVLVEDAGRRGAFDEVLRRVAAERGAEAPARCALAISEETNLAIAVRGADGRITGSFGPRGAPVLGVEARAALAGCPLVDVFARAPHYGRAELLRGIPARFRAGPATLARTGAGPIVIVANPNAPAALEVAPLLPVTAPPDARLVAGAEATPAHVLEALKTASFVEIHAHSLVGDDTNIIVLSEDGNGRYALGVRELAGVTLAAHPVVVLAACETAQTGTTIDTASNLADAFLAAGASAVIASPAPVGDADAPAFFAAVRARVLAGADPTGALEAARRSRPDGPGRTWIDRLVVFQ